MGLLRDVIADEGAVRLADFFLSAAGMMVALWFVVRWSRRVSRE